MLNSAFLYSFQSNKETENQMFKIGLGRIGCLQISLTSAGIMSTWFLIKLLWLQANIRFKLINLQNSVKGTETALTRGDALN